SGFLRIPSIAMVFSPSSPISPGYLNPFRKQMDKLKSSPPPSPTQLSPSWCLWLVSALQGHELTSDVRRQLADDIEQMGYVEQEDLIEFLETGAAPSTLENNACKQFLCNTTELYSALALKDPENLVTLWDQLFHHILPSLQSILYPLQRTRPGFDLRRTILTIFRDRVLSKILRDVQNRIPILEPMLYTVLLETDSQDEDSRQFAALASRIMGTKNRRSAVTVTRIRSRTLPNKPSKKVTWSDMRKSATFIL
uniref:EF-hand_13 domain-containing protein n=1 Tax=Haemonchus contortus TaxID=6289 RepID=A0A7I4Y8Y2_HAECO